MLKNFGNGADWGKYSRKRLSTIAQLWNFFTQSSDTHLFSARKRKHICKTLKIFSALQFNTVGLYSTFHILF